MKEKREGGGRENNNQRNNETESVFFFFFNIRERKTIKKNMKRKGMNQEKMKEKKYI
jgi:hypothetical protein